MSTSSIVNWMYLICIAILFRFVLRNVFSESNRKFERINLLLFIVLSLLFVLQIPAVPEGYLLPKIHVYWLYLPALLFGFVGFLFFHEKRGLNTRSIDEI